MTPNSPQPWTDTTTLETTWTATLGEIEPLGNALRGALPVRWMRLYYLPDGERIVASAAQRATVVQRFAAILAALGCSRGEQLVVTTCGWASSVPAARPSALGALLPAAHWRDIADADPEHLPTSVYATAIAAGDPAMAEFLLDWVAAERTAEAIIAPPSFEWLVHPYDGGLDVIARDRNERQRLAEQFATWRSGREDGL